MALQKMAKTAVVNDVILRYYAVMRSLHQELCLHDTASLSDVIKAARVAEVTPGRSPTPDVRQGAPRGIHKSPSGQTESSGHPTFDHQVGDIDCGQNTLAKLISVISMVSGNEAGSSQRSAG